MPETGWCCCNNKLFLVLHLQRLGKSVFLIITVITWPRVGALNIETRLSSSATFYKQAASASFSMFSLEKCLLID